MKKQFLIIAFGLCISFVLLQGLGIYRVYADDIVCNPTCCCVCIVQDICITVSSENECSRDCAGSRYSIISFSFCDHKNNKCVDFSTLITLDSFNATPGNKIVRLNWSTATEINCVGFNIYRAESEDGRYVKINAAVIPAEGSDTAGASYEFTDTAVKNGRTYYYKLEDLDLNGTATMHGPASATPRFIFGIFGK